MIRRMWAVSFGRGREFSIRQPAVVETEEAEVRGAHLPKIAEGGAASVVIVQATEIKDKPAPLLLRLRA
jgi:hypothetical protein